MALTARKARRLGYYGSLSVPLVLTVLGCATGEDLGEKGAGGSVDSGAAAGGSATGGTVGSGGTPLGFTGGSTSSVGGAGGLVDSGAPEIDGAAGGDSDGGSPVGEPCPDPEQKRCGGLCVAPSPALGCGLDSCSPCPDPPLNGFTQCTAAQCDFACSTGFEVVGDACDPIGGSGGSGGAGGAGGAAGTGGSGGSDPTCSDGVRNGAETDTDCGGAQCSKCTDGKRCAGGGDCVNGVCARPCSGSSCNDPEQCRPPRCDDGVKNALETDVDCGGNCGATCDPGKACGGNGDCSRGPCESGICGCTPVCPANACGAAVDDGCGATTSCNCPSGQTCNNGQCCTPRTCAQQGAECGSVPNGCGGMLSCGNCSMGSCTANQCVCGNRDGDSLDDCEEANDGDPWTDPDIFNGMHVRQRNQCSSGGNCNENDTRAKVTSCMSGSIQEELDQYSGWDWNNPPDSICNAGYGFMPNWTECDSTWQAEWSGFINLKQAGNHCFNITGSTNEACASLFFDAATNGIQTGAPTQCFDVAAGAYPILWHYTMDNGSSSSMHVNYCFGGASTCTPTTAIPAAMLRVQR